MGRPVRTAVSRIVQRMRRAFVAALGPLLLVATLPALAAGPQAAGDGLRPGQYRWTPELAPQGPVSVIVSLPEQRAYVYRNGVRIGISTTSTGKRGHATPPGIYTILQKRREHYSNLYDSAPMPFMQRLTWDGIALHAGALPGFPASHGCVRLPRPFAERLFATTGLGTVVVVADAATSPPALVSPGLFAPIDSATGSLLAPTPAPAEGEWKPERAPQGTLTILLSTADRQLLVLREAMEIGRAPVRLDPALPAIGTRAYLLLDDQRQPVDSATGVRPRRWQALSMPGSGGLSETELREAFSDGRIAVPEAFARQLQAELQAGTTVLLTDQPLQPHGRVDVLTTAPANAAPPTGDPP